MQCFLHVIVQWGQQRVSHVQWRQTGHQSDTQGACRAVNQWTSTGGGGRGRWFTSAWNTLIRTIILLMGITKGTSEEVQGRITQTTHCLRQGPLPQTHMVKCPCTLHWIKCPCTLHWYHDIMQVETKDSTYT